MVLVVVRGWKFFVYAVCFLTLVQGTKVRLLCPEGRATRCLKRGQKSPPKVTMRGEQQ